jgi:hypothetical protein
MAQKKLPKLDELSKRAVHCAAKTIEGSKALAALADQMLAESDTNAWRNVSEQHKEVILYRIRGGELLTGICRSIGLDPANIRNLAAMDDDFDKRLALAYAHGQHAHVERLHDIARDTTLSDARAKLLSDNIKWIAARSNRKAWGDSLQVDQTGTVTINAPQWMYGSQLPPPTINGEIIDPDTDQHD